MLLRAFTFDNECVEFTLSDCPVFVSAGVIGLAGREWSKLLSANTIARGDEKTGVFEGDLVYSGSSLIGRIIFAKGFKLQKLDGSVETIKTGKHIRMRKGTIRSTLEISRSPHRTPMYLKYKDCVIQIGVFLSKDNKTGEIIASGATTKNNSRIVPEQIRWFTGLELQTKEKVFLDDLYKGGTVVLEGFDLAIRYIDGHVDLIKED